MSGQKTTKVDPAVLAELSEFFDTRFEGRGRSFIETHIRALLADFERPLKLAPLGEANVRHIITSLRPQEDTHAGQQLLLKILETRGPRGVDDFLHKMTRAIHDKGKLDKDADFDDLERKLYHLCTPNLSRRKMLVGVAGMAGFGLFGHGVSKFGEQLLGEEKTEPHHREGWRKYVGATVDGMKAAEPYVEMTGGAVTLAYALKEYWDVKLEQVCRAVTELSHETRRGNIVR